MITDKLCMDFCNPQRKSYSDEALKALKLVI